VTFPRDTPISRAFGALSMDSAPLGTKTLAHAMQDPAAGANIEGSRPTSFQFNEKVGDEVDQPIRRAV
jgi:hypothetical protein